MKLFLSILICCFSFFTSMAQKPSLKKVNSEFYQARVVEVLDEGTEDVFGQNQIFQSLKLKREDGKVIKINKGDVQILDESQKLKIGDLVVVKENQIGTHFITERYRINPLIFVTLIFIFLALLFGQKKGFFSLVGLAFSVFVLGKFILPLILAGHDPLIVCVIGGIIIATISIYLSHGFSKRTSVAVLSTFLTFLIALFLSIFFVKLTSLFGLGSEQSFYLHMNIGNIDLRGILLGGIIISTVGILDDVTTTQCATIDEILKSNPRIYWEDLWHHGMSVGKEHIASLINTLALAYVGASLPMLLLYANKIEQPLWTVINSEFIAEEIVRTLAGSSALILAVPISTYLAVFLLRTKD